MDGWITIGTQLSTDKFDRQIMQLEKKMQKEEDKKVNLEVQMSTQEQDLESARKKVDELADAYQRLQDLQEKASSGKATYQDFTELQGIQNTYGSLENIGSSFDKALDKQIALENKVAQTKTKYDELNGSINDAKRKIEGIKLQKQQADVDKLKNGFKDVGNNIQKAVKKAGMFAISIIGIRSGLAMLRRASSELASYDEQYATDLEYIRFVLTQAIAPVLRGIVQLGLQLLQIVGMISQALFGVNIFSSGSAENFQKMKSQASGVGKAVKEIRKQLMGFDEVNILTDQSDTGTSAGAGGVTMPSFDISEMQGKPPEWMRWITENKDKLIGTLTTLGTLIGGIKIAEFLKNLGLIDKVPLGKITLIAIGIGGIVYAIANLIEYLDNPSFENFGQIIEGVGLAILGIGGAIIGLPAIIAGAVIAILGVIISKWEEIKAFFEEKIQDFRNFGDVVREIFGDTAGDIWNSFADALQDILDFFDNIFTSIKGQFDGLIKFISGVFEGDWDKAWEGIREGFDAWWEGITGVLSGIPQYIYDNNIAPVLELVGGLWDEIVKGAKEGWEKIKLVFSIVGSFFEKTFRDAWEKVVRVFNVGGEIFNNLRDGIVNSFKYIVNRIISGLNQVITIPFNNLNYVLRNLRNIDIMGIKPFGWVGTVSIPQIPYLKSGGIVNMPNRGTLVGNAFAGESGREGVIPLTDEQTMAELGREIGKHIVMNLTNITTLDGRRINRELRRLQNDNEFAYNY